jgi:non-specific serine/threonine protein kinase
MSSPPWIAHTEYEYGIMLLARAGEGDSERAQALLGRALATAEALGMAGLAQKARALLATAAVTPTPSAAEGVCRLEGNVWTLTFGTATIRLQDMRGLHYLAQLLRHPGREFHVTELVADPAPRGNGANGTTDLRIATSLGDAGPRLDRQAQMAYRRRLDDLRDRLAETEEAHDLGASERVRAEIDALQSELANAARGKRSASHGERARIAVSKGLKTALQRISAGHPELGAHLDAAVRRGYYCSYAPDPRHPFTWRV